MREIYRRIDFAFKESGMKLPWALLVGIGLILYPHVMTSLFMQNMGILIIMWACLASAWNIFGGYTGQVSLGQAMFFGAGAYGTVLPLYYFKVTTWIGLLVGVLLAVLLALIIAIPIFKLSAQYFAIATVALGETVRTIAVNAPFTFGMQGIDFVVKNNNNPWLWLQFRNKLPYYYLFLIVLVIVFALMLYINCSRMGYYFRTIKANQIAAESVGINSRKYKTIALVMSAAIAGLCGGIYSQYVTYIDPSTVLINTLSTRMIIMAVIGGIGTIQGPLIGALLLVPLSEYNRIKFGNSIPGLDILIFGVLIIIIVLFQPEGIVAIIRNLRNAVLTKMGRKAAN